MKLLLLRPLNLNSSISLFWPFCPFLPSRSEHMTNLITVSCPKQTLWKRCLSSVMSFKNHTYTHKRNLHVTYSSVMHPIIFNTTNREINSDSRWDKDSVIRLLSIQIPQWELQSEWPQVFYLTSLLLSFLIYKIKMVYISFPEITHRWQGWTNASNYLPWWLRL